MAVPRADRPPDLRGGGLHGDEEFVHNATCGLLVADRACCHAGLMHKAG